MCDTNVISRLYTNALKESEVRNKLSSDSIRIAIQNMKEVYKPNPGSMDNDELFVADYNDPAHRCAYLHKYASLHTALVADILLMYLESSPGAIFHHVNNGDINICSLGGGPGCDIIGITMALGDIFDDTFHTAATVVDLFNGWKQTFAQLVSILRNGGGFGSVENLMNKRQFYYNYMHGNLLGQLPEDVRAEIAKANLITMVKFVSAASCTDTSKMIQQIFNAMQPGALAFYIDNAGGGFHKMMNNTAKNCGMLTQYGPLKHFLYSKPEFGVKRYGYTPCCETKVTAHIWMKPYVNDNMNIFISNANARNADISLLNPNVVYQQPNVFNNQNSNPFMGKKDRGRGNNRRRSRSRSRGRNRRRDNFSVEDSDEEEREPDCNDCCVIS